MKLLLHVCCATCVAGVIEQLKNKFDITCYFYNPNIHPREEYECRLSNIREYCRKVGIPLIEGKYDKERWFEVVKGLEKEPEGGTLSVPDKHAKRAGQRCIKCYTMRLEETVRIAIGSRDPIHPSKDPIHPANVRGRRGPLPVHRSEGVGGTSPRFDFFSTTLTISPHKKAETINKIGQSLGQKYGVKFYGADFKKNDGFKRACEIARREGFYRQNYCGCVFSKDVNPV